MSRLRRCPSGSAVSLALASAGCFSPTGSVPATTGLTDTNTTQDPSTQTSVEPTTTAATTEVATASTTDPTTSTSGTGSSSDATTLSDTPVCGNGLLEPGETCDDGKNNADTAPCRADCTPAVCGDMFRCPTCAPLEECDDGNVSANDGCSETCRLEGRLIFLTPAMVTGDITVMNADALCQELGAAHFLPDRSFIAWLSTSIQPIVTRIGSSPIAYRVPGGEIVAADTKTLLNAELTHAVDQEASGAPVAGDAQCSPEYLVWTGTEPNGVTSELTCGDWTLPSDEGQAGSFFHAGPEWTSSCSIACASSLRLYCIETAL